MVPDYLIQLRSSIDVNQKISMKKSGLLSWSHINDFISVNKVQIGRRKLENKFGVMKLVVSLQWCKSDVKILYFPMKKHEIY